MSNSGRIPEPAICLRVAIGAIRNLILSLNVGDGAAHLQWQEDSLFEEFVEWLIRDFRDCQTQNHIA